MVRKRLPSQSIVVIIITDLKLIIIIMIIMMIIIRISQIFLKGVRERAYYKKGTPFYKGRDSKKSPCVY